MDDDFWELRRRYMTDPVFHAICEQMQQWERNKFATRSDLRAAFRFLETIDRDRHPMTDRLLKFFAYDHLTDPTARETSRCFADLANQVAATVPQNPERTVALRKLLEAKDCAVRAVLEGAG